MELSPVVVGVRVLGWPVNNAGVGLIQVLGFRVLGFRG